MGIKALMVDVDGVLVNGRPGDGLHWQTSVEPDFGFTPGKLHEAFFAPYWEQIVLGRAGMMEHLPAALQKIAPQVSPASFLSYWLQNDSRLSVPLLEELAVVRAAGTRVYLATKQEHLRVAYLMGPLGLAECVDGMFHSAVLGARKPDAEFFTKVQANVGLDGRDILLIDDSLLNVLAAREVGWQAHLWTANSSPRIVRSLCARPEGSSVL